MMIVPAGVKVHLALGYTDMRKGMDGLAMLVQQTLKQDPFSGHLFALDRRAERPVAHLQHFSGVLHVDGYAGFEQLARKGDAILAACWAHARRKFYDVAQAAGSPVATEVN